MHFFGYDIIGPAVPALPRRRRDGALVRSVDITIPGPVDGPRLRDHRAARRLLRPARRVRLRPARAAAVPRRVDARTTAHASASCRVTAATPTCGGPTSSSATCTTRLNAYDDGDRVVVDVVRWPEMFATDPYGPGASAPPTLDRWTIDPAAGKVVRGTARRPSPGVPARRRAPGRAAAPLRLRDRRPSSTSRGRRLRRPAPARPRPGHRRHATTSAPAPLRARRSSSPPSPTPARTRAGCSRSSTTPPATRATSRSSTPPTSRARRSRRCTCPRRVPFGFHGSWVAGASLD